MVKYQCAHRTPDPRLLDGSLKLTMAERAELVKREARCPNTATTEIRFYGTEHDEYEDTEVVDELIFTCDVHAWVPRFGEGETRRLSVEAA
jgi:hypothetical protein